jgi:tRNA modification GTPase
MYQEDTIAAIATAMGEGGVAIVRISGPDAEKAVRAIFVRSRQNDIKLRSHMLYQGSIRDQHADLILDFGSTHSRPGARARGASCGTR